MRSLFSKVIFRLIECEQTMLLLSRAMEEPLRFVERVAIRLHCFFCPGCDKYRGQLPWLRSAMRHANSKLKPENVATFTVEEKERLKELLCAADDE